MDVETSLCRLVYAYAGNDVPGIVGGASGLFHFDAFDGSSRSAHINGLSLKCNFFCIVAIGNFLVYKFR